MRTSTFRALSAIAIASTIFYGCSKSNTEKPLTTLPPDESTTFMLPDGSHFMGL